MNHRLPLWLPVLAGWLLLVSPGLTVGQMPDSPTAPPPEPGQSGLTPAEALQRATTEITAAEEAREAGSGEWQPQAEKALRLAEYVLSVEPLNPRGQFIKGRVLLLNGRAREAREYIRTYTEDKREGQFDWLGFKLLGDILLEGKYYELAEAKYEQALELNRQEPRIFLGLAAVEANRKKYPEAADHARQGIALQSPPRAQYHALLARILLDTLTDDTIDSETRVRNLSEAQAEARQAVELVREKVRESPSEVNLLNQLNNMLALQRVIEDRRMAFYPELADAYMTIARIVQDQADLARLMAYHQAIIVLERGVEKTGEKVTPELLYELARLMYAVGRVEDARATLDLLLAKDPDHAEGQALRAKLGEAPAP